jgi:glycosyltransferase involved in cell wall biosynthesis
MSGAEIVAGESGHPDVLVLAPSPDISGPVPGPIGRLAYRLVDALDSVGYDVEVELWGRHRREERLAEKVLGRGVDLVRVRRHVRHGAFDLVFVNTTHDWPALLRELALVHTSPGSVRWVLLFHGSHSEWFSQPGRRLFKSATRALIRRTSAVLLLSSEEVTEWGRYYPQGNFSRVANAFVPMRQTAVEPLRAKSKSTVPRLLFVGRLIRGKGVYELLEAFAAMRSTRPCHLTVAGEGPEAEGLQLRAKELGIDRDVDFTGFLHQEQVGRVYEHADIFVLPTYREGLPTVLLEAMSFGLPIVTTPIRGAADYLVDGDNVLFVPPKDSDALAVALNRLLDDEDLCRAMSENNVLRVRDFAPDRVVVAYERVFEEVLGRT